MKYVRIKKCIFCGMDTSNSNSIEHIVPESLGNNDWVLEKGVVCDKCNNYFARKIENIVLNLDGFRQLRFYCLIDSKKGKIPSGEALIAGGVAKLDWEIIDNKPCILMGVDQSTIENIKIKKPEVFIAKEAFLDDEKHKYEISRFLYKIAFEYFVYSCLNYYEDKKIEVDELLFSNNMRNIRDFVRKGNRNKRFLEYEYLKKSDESLNPFKPQTISINSHCDDKYLTMEIRIINSVFIVKIQFDD